MTTLIKYFEWITISGCRLPFVVKIMIKNLSSEEHFAVMHNYFENYFQERN